jgi:hypothetical protein
MTERVANILRNSVDLLNKRDFLSIYKKLGDKKDISQAVGIFKRLNINPYPFVKTLGDIWDYDKWIVGEEFFKISSFCFVSTKDSRKIEEYIQSLAGLINYYVTQADGFYDANFKHWTQEMVDKINKNARAEGYAADFFYVSPEEVKVSIKDALVCPSGWAFGGLYIDQNLCSELTEEMREARVLPRFDV